MNNSANLYVRLFHGRNQPNDMLDDWGFDGPVIGPVGVTWTYGDVKLHDPEWIDFETMVTHLGLIYYDGKYYGDFEVFVEGDPSIADGAAASGQPIHTYEMYVVARRAAVEPQRRAVLGRPVEPLNLP